MPSIQAIDTVCTGRILQGFPDDYQWNSAIQQDQKITIESYLNQCKASRVVNVLSFLIATQTKIEDLLVNTFGFKEVSSSHNYKYPDTSKYLKILVKDMNEYEVPVEKPVVNPFQAAPQAQPAQADRWFALTRSEDFLIQHGGTLRPNQTRTTRWLDDSRYKVIIDDDGDFVSPDGLTYRDPFPLNSWVEIPLGVHCPLLNTGNRFETIYVDTLARNFIRNFTPNSTRVPMNYGNIFTAGNRLIAVRRIAPYTNGGI